MSNLKKAERHPEELLWDELGDVHAGLLGIVGSEQHLQPMAHHADRAGRRLWFLTKRDSDLVQSLKPGDMARFAIISKKQDFHASMRGVLSERRDQAMLDEMWNRVSGSWFDGKDDPSLVMLALDLKDAGLWASTGSSVAFAWEIAKANMSDAKPDVGVRSEVVFA